MATCGAARPLLSIFWLAFLVPCVAACGQTIVLGSECPGTSGPCSTEDAGVEPPVDARTDEEDSATAPDEDAAGSCEADAPEQVMAHWPLDDSAGLSAADATGRGPTGILQGFVEPLAWTTGTFAGALQFDGVNDHVQVGSISGELRALSLWLKPGGTHVSTKNTPVQLPTSHGPANDWFMPENAYRDDGLSATVGTLIGVTDQQQHWGGFHLAEQLPRGARIQGITVTLATGNLGVAGGFIMELSWDGGRSHTDSRYGWGQLIIGSNVRPRGGPTALWNRTWVVDEFSAANFRARAGFNGIVNAMAIDYFGVQVHYAEQATPRTILMLSADTTVEFGADSKTIATTGWPESTVYVNGAADGTLHDGWNHVAVVGQLALSASDVQLGKAPTDHLGFAYQGLMDDVQLFEQTLTPEQVAQLSNLDCAP